MKLKYNIPLVGVLLVAAFALPASAATTVSIGNFSAAPGGSANGVLTVNNVIGFDSANISITYNTSVVVISNIVSADPANITVTSSFNNAAGSARIIANENGLNGLNGTFAIASITFTAVGTVGSSSALNIIINQMIDPTFHNIPATAVNGNFTITGGVPPAITSWGNNKTSNTQTSITVNASETVRFNASANQSIATWNWYLDGSNVINNVDNFVNTFAMMGVHTVAVNATNSNGTSNTIIWTVTVQDNVPPVVSNPSANPAIILSDNGRPRPPGTNITTLNVTVTDNVAVGTVLIDLSPIGGQANAVMTNIGGNTYSITTNATAGINLTNNLVVTANDTSGNINNSVSIPVTVLLRGDIYRDGTIDLKDLLFMRRYIAGLEPSINMLVADIYPDIGDGNIDLRDLLFLRRYIAGLEPLI